MVWTVPKVRREYFGYKPVAPLPTTYPCKYITHNFDRIAKVTLTFMPMSVPAGPRNPPSGYED